MQLVQYLFSLWNIDTHPINVHISFCLVLSILIPKSKQPVYVCITEKQYQEICKVIILIRLINQSVIQG